MNSNSQDKAAQVQQEAGMNGEAVAVYQLSFEVEGRGWQDTDKATFDFWQGKDRVSRVLYTHPAADALGAVRELVGKWLREIPTRDECFGDREASASAGVYSKLIDDLEAALAQAPAVRVTDEMARRAEIVREQSLRKIASYGSAGVEERHNMAMHDALEAVLGQGKANG